MNKTIRKAGREDKRRWVETNLIGGSWEAVRKLRRPAAVKHAGVKNLDGHLTDTAARPDALADYFEKVQWQVRFPDSIPTSEDLLGPVLNVDTTNFTMLELQAAIRKMKNRKAAGPDDIPPEFWKAVAKDDDACDALLQ